MYLAAVDSLLPLVFLSTIFGHLDALPDLPGPLGDGLLHRAIPVQQMAGLLQVTATATHSESKHTQTLSPTCLAHSETACFTARYRSSRWRASSRYLAQRHTH